MFKVLCSWSMVWQRGFPWNITDTFKFVFFTPINIVMRSFLPRAFSVLQCWSPCRSPQASGVIRSIIVDNQSQLSWANMCPAGTPSTNQCQANEAAWAGLFSFIFFDWTLGMQIPFSPFWQICFWQIWQRNSGQIQLSLKQYFYFIMSIYLQERPGFVLQCSHKNGQSMLGQETQLHWTRKGI